MPCARSWALDQTPKNRDFDGVAERDDRRTPFSQPVRLCRIGKSHGENTPIASGISGDVVNATLMPLPMKVASAGGSPCRCGLRNRISNSRRGRA